MLGGHQSLLFPLALLAGGLAAALAGLVVGVPSLRLRGDYLAIVTLGFGEIIRVVIQNIDRSAGHAASSAFPHTPRCSGPRPRRTDRLRRVRW